MLSVSINIIIKNVQIKCHFRRILNNWGKVYVIIKENSTFSDDKEQIINLIFQILNGYNQSKYLVFSHTLIMCITLPIKILIIFAEVSNSQ